MKKQYIGILDDESAREASERIEKYGYSCSSFNANDYSRFDCDNDLMYYDKHGNYIIVYGMKRQKNHHDNLIFE